MTREADALLLFCPQPRSHSLYVKCYASGCMAWRWLREPPRQRIDCPDRYATVEEGMVRPARALTWVFAPWDGDDTPAQWLEPQADVTARREGYCGLAGSPA